MATSTVRRWLGAASIAAVAALTPQVAFASDEFKVHNSREAFEAALNASHGGSHTLAPAASGVTFTTAGIASAPTYYAAGQSGNLFGDEAASVGYTGVGPTGLNMTLPSTLSAFGFDYRYSPTWAIGQGATFVGEFCNEFFGCHSLEISALSGGSGFIGITTDRGGVDGALLSGTANHLQVANLTFAGQMSTVPEPGTIALLGTGIAGLAGFGVARRRRESSNS